jgi:hypothetical protein
MTALEARIVRLELMLTLAQQRIATLGGQTAALEGQNRQSAGPAWNLGGSGGGTGAFWCNNPGIAGNSSGIADVYQINGGTNVLFAAGATIWNLYPSPTTAGRACTLGQNPDGTFMIFGQSCT